MISASRRRFLPLLFVVLFVPQPATAERLPIKSYTPADGLSHYVINQIVRDSHGFLWFCTNDGLSLFDGYTFTNYRTEHGLPHSVVNDILETVEGEYWVATDGGLARFNPRGEATNRVIYAGEQNAVGSANPMFTSLKTLGSTVGDRKVVTRVVQRADRSIWVGTLDGVFRLAQAPGGIELREVEVRLPGAMRDYKVIYCIVEDRFGTLWIGGASGLFRLWPNGESRHYPHITQKTDPTIHDLLIDRTGSLWAGTRFNGLIRMAIGPEFESPIITSSFNSSNGINSDWVFDLHESSDGNLWVGSNSGLSVIKINSGTAPSVLNYYSKQNGFTYHEITQVGEDRDNNIWLGSVNGAMKIIRDGFTTFDERDGICCVLSVFSTNAGEVSVYANLLLNQQQNEPTGANPQQKINFRRSIGSYDGKRFTWVTPDVLLKRNLGWTNRLVLQALNGEWWIGTGEGLFRFPKTSDLGSLKVSQPIASYTTKDGLAASDVFRIFEDSKNNLWVSTIGAESNGLARWERASDTLSNMAHTPGLPSLEQILPTAFEEDRVGNVWIGLSQGGLARYRDGQFKVFSDKEGLRPGRISDLYLDRVGRLWVAMTRGGVTRVDDPGAETLHFVNYTVEQGLSSDYTTSITEDDYGRIYIGTGRGLDRLDPSSGGFKRYTAGDGLAIGSVLDTARDRNGSIWVATAAGLSVFRPQPVRRSAPPPILINGLSIAGAQRRVSAIGETQIKLDPLQPGENVQVDFVGLSFAFGESLQYQYLLEGAGTSWSQPSAQRTINFANLAPGTYRFLVRALNSEGVSSTEYASVSFTVLHPVWQRWWFLAIVAMIVALATYTLYRRRVSHLLELERVRTRIASDLHDDIGAGLSRIAVLSEVAQHEVGDGVSPVKERLSVIAGASRELVDSMSDIVWAVNPKRDQLSDLIQRMRRFASDVFTARGIEFTFRGPVDEQHLKVGADIRRHIYLIFKEGINNTVRYSGCTKSEITLRVESAQLALTLKDNGRGFDPTRVGTGNGLLNMHERARILGGRLLIDSRPGQGTTIQLRVPLNFTLKEKDRRLRGNQKM